MTGIFSAARFSPSCGNVLPFIAVMQSSFAWLLFFITFAPFFNQSPTQASIITGGRLDSHYPQSRPLGKGFTIGRQIIVRQMSLMPIFAPEKTDIYGLPEIIPLFLCQRMQMIYRLIYRGLVSLFCCWRVESRNNHTIITQ